MKCDRCAAETRGYAYRLSRMTFIVPPAPRLAPPGPEFAYASDDAGLVQRVTDSAGTHYSTASWPMDHDGDEDFEPRLREPTGFKWTPVISERATIVELEGHIERSKDYIDELSRRLEASTRWREWAVSAAKALAAQIAVGKGIAWQPGALSPDDPEHKIPMQRDSEPTSLFVRRCVDYIESITGAS